MPEDIVQLPADGTGKKTRARSRAVGANTIYEPYMLLGSERVVSYRGFTTTFRILGRANALQTLFTFFNAAGSPVLVALRRVSLQVENTAALITVTAQAKTSRITVAPTGGTAVPKFPFDTTMIANANAAMLMDASADGTNSATALAATGSGAGWQQLVQRQATAVGQILFDDAAMLPQLAVDDPIILRASEGLAVQIVGAAANNPATNQYVVNCVWEEFTLP